MEVTEYYFDDLTIDHLTGKIIGDDKTVFELTAKMGKFGFQLLRNGKQDKKWNEAIKIFKAYDPIEDSLRKAPYTGSVFAILNNGSMLIWDHDDTGAKDNGHWAIYTLHSKVETDIALQMLGQPPFFGTTEAEQIAHIEKTIPKNKNGTFFKPYEYLAASIFSRRHPIGEPGKRLDNSARVNDSNVTWGLWGTNYNDGVLNAGAYLDLQRYKPELVEVNAKWGTSLIPKQKGVFGKVLLSTVVGALGGPVGMVLGFAGAVAKVEAEKKAMKVDSRLMATEFNKGIEIAKQAEIAKKIEADKTAALQASSMPIDFSSPKTWFIVGGIIVLVLLMFLKRKT